MRLTVITRKQIEEGVQTVRRILHDTRTRHTLSEFSFEPYSEPGKASPPLDVDFLERMKKCSVDDPQIDQDEEDDLAESFDASCNLEDGCPGTHTETPADIFEDPSTQDNLLVIPESELPPEQGVVPDDTVAEYAAIISTALEDVGAPSTEDPVVEGRQPLFTWPSPHPQPVLPSIHTVSFPRSRRARPTRAEVDACITHIRQIGVLNGLDLRVETCPADPDTSPVLFLSPAGFNNQPAIDAINDILCGVWAAVCDNGVGPYVVGATPKPPTVLFQQNAPGVIDEDVEMEDLAEAPAPRPQQEPTVEKPRRRQVMTRLQVDVRTGEASPLHPYSRRPARTDSPEHTRNAGGAVRRSPRLAHRRELCPASFVANLEARQAKRAAAFPRGGKRCGLARPDAALPLLPCLT